MSLHQTFGKQAFSFCALFLKCGNDGIFLSVLFKYSLKLSLLFWCFEMFAPSPADEARHRQGRENYRLCALNIFTIRLLVLVNYLTAVNE